MSIKIAVDVGGTFVDFVCCDEHNRLSLLKGSSTPDDPSRAVVEGVEEILERSGAEPSDVTLFVHGTTVATNTLLERKGATVALIGTEGFRDVLEIARQDRPSLYDYALHPPKPLAPRRLRFETPERIGHDGRVRRPLERDAVADLIERIAAGDVRDLAVCLLHSYANPVHERLLKEWIAEAVPDARISLSSELLPEIREFERANTTVVNAYVLPAVSCYIHRLEDRLREKSIASPLHIMQSNGGIIDADRAQKHCVQTLLSGPAAGALFGATLAEAAGVETVISIDIGGTSADVSVATGRQPVFAEETEIGGQVVRTPCIEINTVGAGGGSIACIDKGGALQVGPQSAGAQPGPACYGRGGTRPTVTDANVVLGRVNPQYFLGGRMTIDAELAREAIEREIAGPLGMSVEQAAEGILTVVNAVMVKAIRKLTVERGLHPRDLALAGFGGGGPLHAPDLARELGISRVVIPPMPGVSSAFGLLTADFRQDYVRTVLWRLTPDRLGELQAIVEEMGEEALRRMSSSAPGVPVELRPSFDVRYRGQSFSLPVLAEIGELRAWSDLDTLAARFHEAHERTYGHSNPAGELELANIRLAAVGRFGDEPPTRAAQTEARQEPVGVRQVYFAGAFREAAVYRRDGLTAGVVVRGPAILEQPDSTLIIPPGSSGRTDESGNLLIREETS